MDLETWRDSVKCTAELIVQGDAKALDLLSRFVHDADEAKQVLRAKGYGWTGLGILETAQLVPWKMQEHCLRFAAYASKQRWTAEDRQDLLALCLTIQLQLEDLPAIDEDL